MAPARLLCNLICDGDVTLKPPTAFATLIDIMLVSTIHYTYSFQYKKDYLDWKSRIMFYSYPFLDFWDVEHSGYFVMKTNFVKYAQDIKGEIEFFDSNSGKLLFTAPRGRTMDEFLKESKAHGWPSFRDAEVNWDFVRCLPNGEAVSIDGTHLGHNLPDRKGNRYCINLVSVAGNPV